MKERLKAGGLDSFQEHEVLEWMLSYTIPRGDVNPLAHRLINEFGDLSRVLDADFDKLKAVDGVGESTALFLSHYLDVYRRYLQIRAEHEKPRRFETLDDVVQFFRPQFVDLKHEELHALYLDSRQRLIRHERLTKGAIESVRVDLRRLTESSLNLKAAFVILAHNHPSELLLPSQSDVMTTQNVFMVLSRVGVCFLDHLIIGSDDYTSLAYSRECDYMFNRRLADRPSRG